MEIKKDLRIGQKQEVHNFNVEVKPDVFKVASKKGQNKEDIVYLLKNDKQVLCWCEPAMRLQNMTKSGIQANTGIQVIKDLTCTNQCVAFELNKFKTKDDKEVVAVKLHCCQRMLKIENAN